VHRGLRNSCSWTALTLSTKVTGHPIPQTSIHLTFTFGESCWINTTSISLSHRILRNWSLCCRRSGKVCHWNRSRDQYYLSGSDCQHVWGPRVGILSTCSRSKPFNAFKPALFRANNKRRKSFLFYDLLFYSIFIIYRDNMNIYTICCALWRSPLKSEILPVLNPTSLFHSVIILHWLVSKIRCVWFFGHISASF